jgi:hypothetical protein
LRIPTPAGGHEVQKVFCYHEWTLNIDLTGNFRIVDAGCKNNKNTVRRVKFDSLEDQTTVNFGVEAHNFCRRFTLISGQSFGRLIYFNVSLVVGDLLQ